METSKVDVNELKPFYCYRIKKLNIKIDERFTRQ